MPAVDLPGQESWDALTPREGVVLLSAVHSPWWVAGGWALDLYLGRVSRAHKDLDIGIFRQDAASVVAALSGWDFFEAREGVRSPLAVGVAPRAEVNSLWCKRANAAHWQLELMLDESDGESWVFRRIRESLARSHVQSGEIQRGLRTSRLRFSFYTKHAPCALKIRRISVGSCRIWPAVRGLGCGNR
jgi:hypothetical protein